MSVTRYDCGCGGAQFCQGCYTMEKSEYGDYVQYEDYERLESELKDAKNDLFRVTSLNAKAAVGEPLHVEAITEGAAVKAFASAFVEWFKETGGKNYVACSLRDPADGTEYEITMQRAGARTPAQDLTELRARVRELESNAQGG